ncbi:hypothetical protein AWENTII_000473 [Aspergillus wentii]|nr:hypothetical protein MW887_005180 [Aspergillus wentii]
MDRLPSPVLHSICSYIWDTSPPSLKALLLVNIKCYHAAAPFFHRKLTLRISSREDLKQTVTELIDHPLRQQYLTYTRQLNITGKLFRQAISPEDEQQIRERKKRAIRDAEDKQKRYSNICSAAELEPCFNSTFTSDRQDLEDAETDEKSSAWSPLVSLIEKLQYLVELNYSCVNRFPPCLLEALHQFHPSCRLNLDRFRFLSLNSPETDPYELELIRSPCLHSLTVPHVRRDSDSIEDYNEEATWETAKIAPNLKQIRLQRCIARTPVGGFRGGRFGIKPAPWKGFIPPPAPEEIRRGNLTCLALSSPMAMSEKQLNQWSRSTDFSKIRSLCMGAPRKPSDLILASNMEFLSLEKLAIDLQVSCRDENYQVATKMFFDSLPPLKTLRLRGMMNMTLIQHILEKHGPSLQELYLHQHSVLMGIGAGVPITGAEISHIASYCPRVEELDLYLKRTKSDRNETGCYRAIGKFPSLRKVSLKLDCSMPFYNLPRVDEMDGPLDEFDKEISSRINGVDLYNVHIRDVFINGAVDEKLARSIWNTITSCQIQKDGLVSLRIDPYMAGSIGSVIPSRDRSLHMARHYIVTRGEWYSHDYIDIVEVGRRKREERDEKERQFDAKMFEKWGSSYDSVNRKIMQRAWPLSDNLDWRLGWSSWPLES